MARLAFLAANLMRFAEPRSVVSKLGLTDPSLILPGESPAELEQLAYAWDQQYQPMGRLERALLRFMVRSHWLQRRYRRMELAFIDERLAELSNTNSALGPIWDEHARTIDGLARQGEAAAQDFDFAAKHLRRMKAQRLNNRKQSEAARERKRAARLQEQVA